jgi:non-canonical (house-cleaning) NTP pyrophosphatase
MQKQLVYVGSTSEHKLRAVREALDELSIPAEVVGVKAASGVNEQPVKSRENDEILEGATNRARRALFETPIEQFKRKPIFIGIENGIEFTKNTTMALIMDLASIVVIDENNVWYFANSAGHPVNYGDVEDARSRGFDKHTVASVTRERTGCDATDATPYYTGGRMTRAELLRQAVKIALCQWLAAKENTEDLAIIAARKFESTVPFLEVVL